MDYNFEIKRLAGFLHYKIFSRHKRGHGIHSPFVFNLIRCAFNAKVPNEIMEKIEKSRKELLKNDTIIPVSRFGAGSKVFKNKVKVKDLVRTVSVAPKYGRLLFNLVNYLKPSTVIEIGTSIGIGTLYLGYGAGINPVISIEGDENVFKIAQKLVNNSGLSNVTLINDDFDRIFPRLIKNYSSDIFIFIDGNHNEEPLLKYMEQISLRFKDNAVIVIDDIYLNRSMERAWAKISKDEHFSITIDLFKMGIACIKQNISKQHFVIKM